MTTEEWGVSRSSLVDLRQFLMLPVRNEEELLAKKPDFREYIEPVFIIKIISSYLWPAPSNKDCNNQNQLSPILIPCLLKKGFSVVDF